MPRELLFGISIAPDLDFAECRKLAVRADREELDLLGIQDHPYVARYLDTFVLAGDLLSATSDIRVFPDVANLPLRPPALLAKTAAALDLVSGGRFELALGAGGYWDAITRMGVPRRTPGQANQALAEAIAVLRALWSDSSEPVQLDGQFYSIAGLIPGPVPAHPIEIWTGAQGPKALELTGAVADGWAAPIASYLPYDRWAGANQRITEAAVGAGRDPGALRRVAQVVGTITGQRGDIRANSGAEPVRATAAQWACLVKDLITEQGFNAVVFWPEQPSEQQIIQFAREVVPHARDLVGPPFTTWAHLI